jgi:hypothetical protein
MSKIKEVVETLFQIYNKEGDLVDFKLNPTQCIIDTELYDKQQDQISILKARQKGCSSYIMAAFLVECMLGHEVVAMLAHDKDHTEKLLRRSQEFLTNLKGKKPSLERVNANEIYFKKTQSLFYIGTAGSKNFGRSATITRAHLSEIAFYDTPAEIRKGLLQAIPRSGKLVEETTANGWGTWYQKHFFNLIGSSGRMKGIFIPWHIDPEYRSETPIELPLSLEEDLLVQTYNLDNSQLQWRREKILDDFDGLTNWDLAVACFHQEYPLTIEEAFILSGFSLYQNISLSTSSNWVIEGDLAYLKGHPKAGYTYIFGADSSGGTGNDFAAIVGLCLDTKEEVLAFRNNRMPPPPFARKLAAIGKEYNEALLVPEYNSHGISTISILKELYSPNKIYRNRLPVRLPAQSLTIPGYSYGWRTSEASKAYMVGVGSRFLQEDGWKIHSPILYDELKSFGEDPETGKIEGQGDHDDLGISYMLACLGVLKVLKLGWLRDSVESVKEVKAKLIDTSKWRNAEGQLLTSYEDLFKTKKGIQKKNPHIVNMENYRRVQNG